MRDEREARALALFRELITLHGLKHSQIAEFVGLQTVIISKIAAGQMFVPETVLKAFGYKWVLRPLQAPDALLTKSDLALLEQKLQKTEEHLKALREQLGGSDDTESY